MSDNSIHLAESYFLDIGRGCLTRSGLPVHLRRQSYEVLKYLVENRGHLISKDKLIEKVWEGRAVTDGSIGKCIEEIRAALGTEAAKYVRNERGRGYIFDPLVTNGQPPSLSPETEGDADVQNQAPNRTATLVLPRSKSRVRSTVFVFSALLLLSAVAALVYEKYFSARSRQINSIAVMPFTNVTGNANSEYISDGLTENLIDRLAELQGLKVIARSSSFSYKGQQVDANHVGRELAVEAVVVGRVEQRGDTLVVRAELVDARDRTQLWSEQYTRRTTDLQQLQDEITQSITDKLRLRLNDGKRQGLAKHATVNPQAYEFYLNGLFYFNQSRSDDYRKALDYFNEAVLLDPNFALAWAMVSRTNSILGGNSLSNPKDTIVKAKAAAYRALELDESLAEGHLALGRIKQNEWDWAGAEKEYKRAIDLSPSSGLAHREYAQFLSVMLLHTEALNEIRRAQELDPMSIRLKRLEGWLLHLARRPDEALRIYLETLKQNPPTAGTHRALGFIYAETGDYEQSIKQLRQAFNIEGETTGNLCYLAAVLARAGKKKEALEIVERLNRTKDYVSPTELAGVYAQLNDTEGAITLLGKAYAERDLQLQTLNIDLNFDNLRSDSRFKDIVRRVGLPPFELSKQQ